MKNSILLISCLIFATGIFLSCSDDNGTDPNDQTGDVFPMAVGNYWVTQMEQFDSLGNTTDVDTSRVTIVGTRDMGGTSYYVAVDSMEEVDTVFYRKGSDGYYALIPDSGDADTLELTLMPIPYSVGETWNLMEPVDSSGGGMSYSFTYTGEITGETSLSTPAGDFDNALIVDYIIDISTVYVDTMSGDTLYQMADVDTNRNYMVPDVGPVGTDSWHDNGELSDRDRLLEFDLQ